MGRGTYALTGPWVRTSLARYAARGFLFVVIAWFGQANPAFAAKEEQVKLKWRQLGEVVTGKKATVALTDGAILEGRVTTVGAESFTIEVKKTTHEQVYPKGQNSVRRGLVSVVRVKEISGNWRAIGVAIGAAPAAVVGAFAYQLAENEGGATSATGGAVAGLVAGGAAAGYFLGRSADTKLLVISIVPD